MNGIGGIAKLGDKIDPEALLCNFHFGFPSVGDQLFKKTICA